MNPRHYASIAVLALCAWAGACSSGSKGTIEASVKETAKPAAKEAPKEAPQDQASKPGTIAADFALKDSDGKVVHLTDYKGKVVLLDFWATWCPPCKIEIPWFMEFETKYQSRGFEVIGVALEDDGWKDLRPFMAETKFNYRILLGDDNVSKGYGGNDNLPTSFIIDRKGKIAATHVGLASKSEFEDKIEALLKGE